MAAPDPIRLYHFTRIEHLASIARDGLCCDADAQANGRLAVEIGNVGIKDRRRHRAVPLPPGGVVADYVPFYYAARSPMLSAIHNGRVATYAEGQRGLVYICTTLGRVQELGCSWVASDRNAVLDTATFSRAGQELAELVDWPLMEATYWANTADDRQRRERRMAELLVHRRLPWEAVEFIGTRNYGDLRAVRDVLDTLGVSHRPRSDVRAGWYF